MYTDEQIAKMTPKINPVIKMADGWGKKMPVEQYNEKAQKYNDWVIEMGEYIDSVYGEGCGTEFRQIFRVHDCFISLNAGFDIDTKAIEKIVKETKKDPAVKEFIYQPLIYKLAPIRETLAITSVATQVIREAQVEYENNPKKIAESVKQVTDIVGKILPLIAGKEYGQIKSGTAILKEIEDKSFEKGVPNNTARKLVALNSLKTTVNKEVFQRREYPNELFLSK